MQTLNDGRDYILQTHTINIKDRGELKLHKLRNGAYQLGEGSGAKIVTRMEDIALFTDWKALSDEVLDDVQASLDRNAPAQAKQERTLADIETAAASRPGTLDQMARALDSVQPGTLASITKVVMDALVQHGVIPAQSNDQLPASPFIPAAEYQPSATDVLSPGYMTPEAEYRALMKSGLKINPERQVFDPEKVAGSDPAKWPDESRSESGAFDPDAAAPAQDPVGEEPELVGDGPTRGLRKRRRG